LPAYDLLPANDDGTPKNDNDPVRTGHAAGKPITSSLRATNRLIRSTGSWRANFRGLGYLFVLVIASGLTTAFLSLAPFISVRLANLIALLLCAPLATAWTHVVIAAPSPHKSLSSRMRPLRTIYLATWFPIFLLWAATHTAMFLPTLLGRFIGLPNFGDPSAGEGPTDASDIAKALCVIGVSIGLNFLLVIPADAALSRVKASLLPADEDTIVPFDRSFAGRVEPEVVSGRGFATFGAAIKTIPVSGWVRIFVLRVKVFFVGLVVYTAVGAVVVAQMMLLGKQTKGKDGQ
jgi:hypothetical protein